MIYQSTDSTKGRFFFFFKSIIILVDFVFNYYFYLPFCHWKNKKFFIYLSTWVTCHISNIKCRFSSELNKIFVNIWTIHDITLFLGGRYYSVLAHIWLSLFSFPPPFNAASSLFFPETFKLLRQIFDKPNSFPFLAFAAGKV